MIWKVKKKNVGKKQGKKSKSESQKQEKKWKNEFINGSKDMQSKL